MEPENPVKGLTIEIKYDRVMSDLDDTTGPNLDRRR